MVKKPSVLFVWEEEDVHVEIYIIPNFFIVEQMSNLLP